VLRALRDHALGPEVHSEGGPVVLAITERVPGGLQLLLPGFVLRSEPPEWGEVDDHPVIEVRIPERRDALYLVEEGAQLLDQRLLRSKLLALGGGPGVAQLARERLEAPLLVREFWSNMFHLHLIERIARKRMQVQPNGICTRWCCQLPECWSGSSMQ